jgi:MFS family permease
MSDSVIAAGAPVGVFRVGTVLSRAVKLLFGNLPVYLPLSFIPGLPALIFLSTGTPMTPKSAGLFFLVYLAVILFAYPLIQAVILHVAIQEMRGRRTSLGDSLTVGLSRFLPVLGTLLCAGTMVILGLMLLIVPGFILGMRFYVAIPACIAEHIGPSASLRRSAELTSGNRWRLFGLALLVFLIIVIAGAVIGAIIGAILGAILGAAGVLKWLLPAISIMRFILNGFAVAFGAIIAAVVYHDLRVAKEGIDTDRIAAVFD